MFCTLVQIAIGASVAAQTQTDQPIVTVGEGVSVQFVNQKATFLIETGEALSLPDVTRPELAEQFRPVTKIEPDFGYIQNGIWLALEVENVSNLPQSEFLFMHTNFMSEISVWWSGGNGIVSLFEQDRNSTFGSRPVPYSELIAPLTIGAGERGTLYIRYASNGDTVLPLSLVDDIGMAKTINNRLIVDFSFYGLMAMVILASAIFRVLFKKQVFGAYAIYVTSVLLLIFQRDGYAFQFLWPDAPLWNNYSSLPLGAGLPLFAAFFTRTYLKTQTLHPRIDAVLLAVVALQVAVVASSAIVGAALAKQLALVTVSIAILVFISVGVIALRKYGARTLFFLIGWLGLFAATVTMTAIHWTDIEITRAQSLNIMRLAMVFDVIMMGLASVFQVVDLQRNHERLNEERITMLDANLRLHNRFHRMEQRYQIAQALAQMRTELVSDLTHDLRQPIFALRSAIGHLSENGDDPKKQAEIEGSISYLEALVDSALQDALDAEENGQFGGGKIKDPTKINQVFTALQSMFAEDAARNGLDLTFVPTSAETSVSLFPVLRIMANFVANAVRHAPNARAVVGLRRKDNALSLEVHDTGPGLTNAELSAVMERAARAGEATVSGTGLGFSIVSKLADQHNLEWSFDSRIGEGSIARVYVPLD